jgi:aspartyl protease family protein
MRNLMIIAAVLVGLGTYMAQMADKMSRRRPPPAQRRQKRPRKRSRRPPAAASTFPATPAAISRPMAASTVSASTS